MAGTTRCLALLPVSLAALTLAAPGLRGDAQEPPVFPADIEVVRLDVTVTDLEGRAVAGLSAEDFEVTEKGWRHEIVSLDRIEMARRRSAAPAPPPAASAPRVAEPTLSRCFVLLIDAPVTVPLRRDFERFFERDLRDGDWVTVIAPRDDIWWTARTLWEHRLLPGLLGRIRMPFGGTSQAAWTAMNVVEYGSRSGADRASRGEPDLPTPTRGEPAARGGQDMLGSEEVYATAVREIRITLAALGAAVRSIADFRGRKTVFLVSAGFIRAPRVRYLFDEVILAARQAGVTIHFVSAEGLPADADTQIGARWLETAAAGAADIAFETGGRPFMTNDVVAPIVQALADSASYYLVGIHPSEGLGEHRVSVRVRREGLRVVARERYYVENPAEARAAAAGRVLRSAFDATGLPLQVSAAPVGPAEPGKTRVELSIGLAGLRAPATVHVQLSGRRSEGHKTVDGETDVSLEPSGGMGSCFLRLEPGIWQLRVVATDTATGVMGSALHTFEVPAARH